MSKVTNYYVTNPTTDVVIVGGKPVGPWMREPVFISRDEAIKLMSAGWGVILRNADVEAGLAAASGGGSNIYTVVDLVQGTMATITTCLQLM